MLLGQIHPNILKTTDVELQLYLQNLFIAIPRLVFD